MSRPPFPQLISLFLRVGNLTFGGGEPTMAVLQRELVSRRAWLGMEDYGLAFSLARITPGTNVLAFCAAAGWRLRGWLGALLAVASVSVPSAVLVVWLLSAYDALRSNVWVSAAVAGTIAAAVGMMAASAVLIVKPLLRRNNRFRCAVLSTGAALLAWQFAVPPIPILAGAALAGFLWRDSEAS